MENETKTLDKKEVGRPLMFKNKEELQKKIDEYFEVTPKEEWIITGLAQYLGTYRQTLMEYQQRDEFADTIKKAKEKVMAGYEIDLKQKGRVGTIFALKNFGWVDKVEIESNVNVSLSSVVDKLEAGGVTNLEREELEALEGDFEDV